MAGPFPPPTPFTAYAPMAAASLPNWFRNGPTGKNIVYSGDSTSPPTASSWTTRTAIYLQTGEALSGCTQFAYGNNGATLASYLANAATFNLAQIVAAAPDLVVFSWGINDVRLGLTSQAQMEAMLDTAVNQLRAAMPLCDIILRTPLAFLSDDPGSTGYVQPLASAQAYATILRKAYQTQVGKWPNVYVWDCQQTISGITCLVSTINTGMSDILHPGSALQNRIVDYMVQNIIGQGTPGTNSIRAGIVPPLNTGLCDAAIAALPATPWSFYPRVVEDTRYFTKITGGPSSLSAPAGSGRIDITTTDAAAKVKAGDLIEVGSISLFVLSASGPVVSNPNATTLRIDTLGGSLPGVTGNYTVNVYRPLYGDGTYAYDSILQGTYFANPVTYPYVREVGLTTSGVNFIRMVATGNDADIATQEYLPADILYVAGQTAVTIGTSFSPSVGAYQQLNLGTGTDYAGFAGRRGWIISARSKPPVTPLFVATTGATVANTVTETTIIGSGRGVASLVANALATGRAVRVKIGGVYSTTSSAPTLAFTIKIGTVAIATITLATLPINASNLGFEIEAIITPRAVGASGTVVCNGKVTFNITAETAGIGALNNAGATTTIDTTAARVINVTATWGTANASNTLTAFSCLMELVNG